MVCRRLAAAALAFSPDRRRWGVKFRTGRIPFAMRSAQAAKAVAGGRWTRSSSTARPSRQLTPRQRSGRQAPYFLYMDSCMRIAAGSPQSWAGALTPDEVAGVIAREQRAYEKAATVFTFSEVVRQAFIKRGGATPRAGRDHVRRA